MTVNPEKGQHLTNNPKVRESASNIKTADNQFLDMNQLNPLGPLTVGNRRIGSSTTGAMQ
jgi:hypothetical protein